MVSKSSAALITALLLSTILVYQPPLVSSQTDYSEEVLVTIIGNSAYWEINLKGGNATIPELNEIESEASGVSSYQLSTIDASRWSPEFEIFSNAGYNLLGFDATPTSGILLKIKSNSFEAAERFAGALSRFLHQSFSKYTSSGGVYTFYSHMEFRLVKGKLWDAVPVQYDGVARLIDKDIFTLQGVPIFKVSGAKVDDGFVHIVTIAGLKQNVLSVQNEFKLVKLLSDINNTKASSVSSSSTVTINTIGSFVTYSDEGAVNNFAENRSATVTVTVEPEENFPDISLDLAQTFPAVIVTRDVDRAALNQGDIVTVGIRVKNAAPPGSTPVGNITVNEDWWKDIEKLEFVDGETSRSLGHLAPGAEFTLAYRLRLTSSEQGEVVAPPSDVTYSYEVEGGEVEESVKINPLTLVLNDIRPAISIEASVETGAPPILSTTPVNLTIRNSGNGHATNLEVEGNSRQSLLSGDIWRLSVDMSSMSLTDLISSRVWSVTWNEGGERKEAVSNSVTLHYNITGVRIPQFNVVRSIVHTIKDGKNLVNETLSINNEGASSLDRVVLRGELPKGFQFLDGNYSLQGDTLSTEATSIETGKSKTYSYSAIISDADENYVVQPTEVSVEASGLKIVRLAKSLVLPLGVKVLKDFETTANFIGANITVDAKVVNKGSIPIFDVTLNVGEDTFLKMVDGEVVHSAEELGKGESLGSRNKVMLLSAGRFEVLKATASFTIAGSSVSQSSESVLVDVYEPITAEMTISPSSPVENQGFTLVLTINNPSVAPVQDVRVNVNLPSEIRVAEGSLQLTAEELGANTSVTRSASLVVGAPMVLSIDPPTVQFKYGEDTFRGTSKPLDILIEDNIPLRYGVPLIIAALLILATAFFARRAVFSKKTQ